MEWEICLYDKVVIEKAESSIKFVDGQKRLMRSPEIAANYYQVIKNHLEKGYVRKIEPCNSGTA